MTARPIPAETRQAQFRASDPATSSWASANAGAGKTYVLTARVARLLLNGNRPDRILCITYTKAAAAEMKSRLFGRLGQWSTLPDGALDKELQDIGAPPVTGEGREERLAAARRLFARALETPGGLKIQTIHSFCQLVLSRFPLEAGLDPGFTVLDDRSASDLLAEARDDVLNLALSGNEPALSEALRVIAARVEETGFETLLTEIRSNSAVFAPLSDTAQLEAARQDLSRQLGVEVGLTEDAVIQDGLSDDALAPVPLDGMIAALSQGTKTDKARSDALKAFKFSPDRALAYEPYRQIFLTKDGDPRKSLATKKISETYADAVNALYDEQSRIVALEDRRRAARVAEATQALLTFASFYLGRYRALKQAQSVLDFDDLIRYTRTLLEKRDDSAWVHFKLDEGIEHILIDEAQDTSPEQWQIVRALAEEFFSDIGAGSDRQRTIFAVGDEKQSIYSFQGAEPQEFGASRNSFEKQAADAEASWHPVDLTLSFRSAPEILRAVDLVFADDSSARMVTVGGGSVTHIPWRAGDGGLVEVWPLVTPDEAPDASPWDAPLDRVGMTSPPAVLAQRIASQIRLWIERGETLPATGKPVRPGDVLILVRRRNNFVDTLIRKLKEMGVPVAGADRLLLTDHIAVMDLMALGAFALLPEDDLTLATILKGPFFGWDDDALFDLAYGRGDTALWSVLQTRAPERHEWAEALTRLEELRADALRKLPFEFYASLLGEGRGFRSILRALGPDATDPVEEFLSLALAMEQQGVSHLQVFLDALTRDPPEIKRDMDTGETDDEAGEVRIMTVHGSKGLEAPIVILPDTCSRPDGKQDPAVLRHPDRKEEVPLWPVRRPDDSPACTDIREALAERREAEYRRLLYVAMTRAQDRLYICGYEGARTRPEDCWYDLVTRGLESDAEEIEDPRIGTILRLGTVPETQSQSEKEGPVPGGEKAKPPWLEKIAPKDKAHYRVVAPSQIADNDPLETHDRSAVLSPLLRSNTKRYLRGRLVHKLLQLLPSLPTEDWHNAGAAYIARAGQDLPDEERAPLLDEVLAIMEDPSFAPLFGPGSRAEAPLTGRVPALGDGVVIDGQVDRIIVTEAAVHLVDYKTNRPAPVDLAKVPEAYVKQMALYRALAKDIFPGKRITCSLLWTDGPHRLTLPEATLDAAFEAICTRAARL